MTRWRCRPNGSTWGDFGADDVLGRLNLVGPEQVRKGIAEVREGRTFSLSLPLDLPGGNMLNANRLPPVIRPTLRAAQVNFNYDMSRSCPGATDIISDDLVVLHTQYSTQWDAFGHVGSHFDVDGTGVPVPVYYNGWRAETDAVGPSDPALAGIGSLGPGREALASTSDAGPVGISHMARHGVQGRAVLIDLAAHFGSERVVVGFEELDRVIAEDGVVAEAGDILLIHTGFARHIVEAGGRPTPDALRSCAVLDGTDQALHEWITDTGIAAIAADNYAVESYPVAREFEGDGLPALPLHELCLFKLGVHLGELWWLSELTDYLRDRGRSRCLLTAPPLRLPGATGSPLTPIATV